MGVHPAAGRCLARWRARCAPANVEGGKYDETMMQLRVTATAQLQRLSRLKADVFFTKRRSHWRARASLGRPPMARISNNAKSYAPRKVARCRGLLDSVSSPKKADSAKTA